MPRFLSALLAIAFSAAAFAQAPTAPQLRIRGTVEALDGQMLTVKANSGQNLVVKLADNFTVMGIAKASVADVASGKYIGTTTVGERNGGMVALEIHIFPENMRGTGEGHRDWDLRPESKMTNANVAEVKFMGSERLLKVEYKGGEKRILVDANTVVVSYAPTDKAELKLGAPIFVVASRLPDGSLSAPRVNVGLNGQVPPM